MTPTAKPCYNSSFRRSGKPPATAFCHRARMMRNWLIYRVYHDVIGQTDGADYFPLVCDFLSPPHVNQFMDAGWFLPLRQEDIFALFAMFERWRASENALLVRQQIQSLCAADPLLSAFFAANVSRSVRALPLT